MENVLIRLGETDKHIIERASNRTNTKYTKNDIISVDELLVAIDDLVDEIDNIKEEFEDYKQNIQENYKQILHQEQI